MENNFEEERVRAEEKLAEEIAQEERRKLVEETIVEEVDEETNKE